MTEQTMTSAIEALRKPLGEIVASNLSDKDFDKHYEGHYEWVRGFVIKMSPISLAHEYIVDYLKMMFKAYFTLQPIGQVVGDPFQQRIDTIQSRRQPDLQIILHTNSGQLTDTAMIGPADICIEVVSQGTSGIDYGDKFEEYEEGGVKEYWIFDPIREEYRFFRRNDQGMFKSFHPDAEGYYQTSLLPDFTLHVATLWQKDLPDILAIVEAVKKMLGKN